MATKAKNDLHDWQNAFKLRGDLLQVDVEKLEVALRTQGRNLLLKNTGAGAKLRAAIDAGWLLEPACEVGDFEGEKRYFYDGKNVDEMHPGAVLWLGNQVDAAYQEATEIPKNL